MINDLLKGDREPGENTVYRKATERSMLGDVGRHTLFGIPRSPLCPSRGLTYQIDPVITLWVSVPLPLLLTFSL